MTDDTLIENTPEIGDNGFSVDPAKLREWVERFERLETTKKEATQAQKDVMCEATAYGYDAKIIRAVIKLRKKDPELVLDEDTKTTLYREALGC